jgi:hypothetical protein
MYVQMGWQKVDQTDLFTFLSVITKAGQGFNAELLY